MPAIVLWLIWGIMMCIGVVVKHGLLINTVDAGDYVDKAWKRDIDLTLKPGAVFSLCVWVTWLKYII